MSRKIDLLDLELSDSEVDSEDESESCVERKNYLRKLIFVCKCKNPKCGCITDGNTPFDCEQIICPNSRCGCNRRTCPLRNDGYESD